MHCHVLVVATKIPVRLSLAQNPVSEFKCGADMVLEQCHTHNNGSIACPQTCEDLDPDQDGDCERYALLACQPQTRMNYSFGQATVNFVL